MKRTIQLSPGDFDHLRSHLLDHKDVECVDFPVWMKRVLNACDTATVLRESPELCTHPDRICPKCDHDILSLRPPLLMAAFRPTSQLDEAAAREMLDAPLVPLSELRRPIEKARAELDRVLGGAPYWPSFTPHPEDETRCYVCGEKETMHGVVSNHCHPYVFKPAPPACTREDFHCPTCPECPSESEGVE